MVTLKNTNDIKINDALRQLYIGSDPLQSSTYQRSWHVLYSYTVPVWTLPPQVPMYGRLWCAHPPPLTFFNLTHKFKSRYYHDKLAYCLHMAQTQGGAEERH